MVLCNRRATQPAWMDRRPNVNVICASRLSLPSAMAVSVPCNIYIVGASATSGGALIVAPSLVLAVGINGRANAQQGGLARRARGRGAGTVPGWGRPKVLHLGEGPLIPGQDATVGDQECRKLARDR